ncbi:MAG TPA: MFS transporter [Spirochaetota bacterium]|nr:MFS transporter [Spirochaetota bacterium]
MSDNKLPVSVKLGYGVCDLGGNLFFTVIGFWLLNFLTDTVGLAAGLAGLTIAIGKIWDAVTDPMTGYLSDRTKSRLGRRRPWMLFGSVPLFLGMILMFTNPALFAGAGWNPAEQQTFLFIWATVFFCLLCTAYTAVNIPYNSLTPELTQDYHERTSLNGYRFGFAVIGSLLGAGASLPIVMAFPDKNIGFSGMGFIFGAIMLITALITVIKVREPMSPFVADGKGFFGTYLKVFKNRPYVLILLTYALHITGLTVVMGIAIYYFKYIHNNESYTTIAMVILLLTAMAFIPISVLLSKKIGKKLVYGIGMAIFAIGILLLFAFGHRFPVSFSFIVMFFTGTGFGFTFAMPYAIVPDAVEYDYLLTGERTEGAFYGIWTFGIKIGQALALAISGLVLSLFGYMPEVAQSESSLLGIRLLLGPIPAVILVLSIVTLYLYPINEKRYNEILAAIQGREAGGR